MGRPRKTTTEPIEQKIETGADHDIDKACDAARPELPKYHEFISSVNKRQGMTSFEKIEEFAKALVVKWKREQDKIRNRFAALNVECSEELDLLDEKITDAKSDLDGAWYDIPESALATKESQRTFMVTYENNIDSKLLKITNLEAQKQKTISNYEEKLRELVEEIEEIERRIYKVSK